LRRRNGRRRVRKREGFWILLKSNLRNIKITVPPAVAFLNYRTLREAVTLSGTFP
jgi:hypothetical protein